MTKNLTNAAPELLLMLESIAANMPIRTVDARQWPWLTTVNLTTVQCETIHALIKKAKFGPSVRLYCCCCGGVTYGRQWPNRDTGYGLCDGCIVQCRVTNVPMGEADTGDGSGHSYYGVRGVHWDLPDSDVPTLMMGEEVQP